MEKEILEIIKIVNQTQNLDIDPADYIYIDLFPQTYPDDSFASQLKQTRAIPHMLMNIIFRNLDTRFIIGSKNTTYFVVDEDNYVLEDKDTGPTIIPIEWSGREVFNYFLKNQHFAALLIKDSASTYKQKRIGKDNQKINKAQLDPEWVEQEDDLIIVQTHPNNLILTTDTIYIHKEDPQKEQYIDILNYLTDLFTEFIEEYQHAAAAPHATYIEWIKDWYPGMIHFKSLE